MMPLVDGKAYYAAALINKEPHKIILSSTLLLVGFSILNPLASAQQRSYHPANLNFNFDSTYRDGQLRRSCNENAGNFDLLVFSHDDIGGATPGSDCCGAASNASPLSGNARACAREGNLNSAQESAATSRIKPGEDSRNQPSEQRLARSKAADFNRDIYYKNKLEFSLDGGWLPINIPFPFDVFEGDPYDLYPLRYTLVPIIASLRWHMDDIGSRWILRGNWDLTFSASATAIPRGAETHYFSYDMGIRRNFVPRNSRVAPYVDIRLGLGLIDAKGPLGVYYAQGQNYTFTANMGSGVRYNFNPRYAISAGLNWMHISNNNLSAPQYSNYGINVYGPMVGIDIQLRRHRRHSEQ
jgi:lipid A 3-O-deacylase PagL